MIRLEDFRHVVPDTRLAEIYSRARWLYGKEELPKSSILLCS